MFNIGTMFYGIPITIFNFNDRFLNRGGTNYFTISYFAYIQQKCEIEFYWSGSNVGCGVFWVTGYNNTFFTSNPLNPVIGTVTTITCEAGRTYHFYLNGYSSSASGGMTATLKKGWYSGARDDYLDYWNGGSWSNPSWG